MTYARLAAQAGKSVVKTVVIVECGAVESSPPASHKKNEVLYQKNIDLFTNVIKGSLSTASIPVDPRFASTLDPASWSSEKPFVQNGQNPKQNAAFNLGAEAVSRGLGGMGTHWTCATPRFHKSELPKLFGDDNETTWAGLYEKAENFLKPIKIKDPKNPFDDNDPDKKQNPFSESIRHYVVLKALQYELPDHQAQQLPLAASKDSPTGADTLDYINWHSPYTIIEPINSLDPTTLPTFTIYTNSLCTKLEYGNRSNNGYTIKSATVKNVRHEAPDITINAKCYIIAAGAVLGPQLLANSKLSPYGSDSQPDQFPIPNVGKWITEQTLSFCQIVFRRDIIDSLDPRINNKDWHLPTGWGQPGDTWPEWIQDKITTYVTDNPDDPLPIPLNDKEPQVTTPFFLDTQTSSNSRPWHTQIHRDAFSYGAVSASIDTRLIVDLRFFGYVEPRMENRLLFEKDIKDAYGMPQPTFSFTLRGSDDFAARGRSGMMMKDMTQVASHLGGYLPSQAPQFMEPGLALHLAGSMRAGVSKAQSVVNNKSLVWDFDNLYLAGNGTIPTGFAENPTLTSVALAINSWESIEHLLTA
jgi:pyranose oxidase